MQSKVSIYLDLCSSLFSSALVSIILKGNFELLIYKMTHYADHLLADFARLLRGAGQLVYIGFIRAFPWKNSFLLWRAMRLMTGELESKQ